LRHCLKVLRVSICQNWLFWNFVLLFGKITRTGEIDTDTANTVIACFQQDYAKFQWISIDNEVIQQAQNLLMKHGSAGLRTLDAIQLACALTLKEEPEACFFTADTLLKSFFKQEGLT